MGYSQAPAFAAVVVLMVFAAANPVADAQVNYFSVTGTLNCPSGTGLPVGPGIPGVTVILNCSTLGATATLGQGVTDATGRFNISVPNLLQSLPIIPSCVVVVQLPLNQTVCPILNTATGILSAVPTLVSTIFSPIFGLVANLVANTFVSGAVGTGV